MTTDIEARLARIFDAERELRKAQEDFFSTGDAGRRLEALGHAVEQNWTLPDSDDATERLMRLGDLLTEAGGPRACQLLLRLLDHEDPGVRASAGEGLIELGHSRYAEVARAMEKVIDDGKATTALAEVPFILAEIGEPGGVKLCIRLLAHAHADVAAAAIEGLAALGDPSSVKALEKLKDDRRKVTSDEDLEGPELTVGELAVDAMDHLRSLHE